MHTGFIPGLSDVDRAVLSAAEFCLVASVIGVGQTDSAGNASKPYAMLVAADVLHTLGMTIDDLPALAKVLDELEHRLHVKNCAGILHFPEFLDRPMHSRRLN